MKKNIFILFFSLLLWAACDDPLIEKPKNLIKEDRMIDMLVDVHLAEATYQNRIRQDSAIDNTTSTDFYYSVLDKYQVADSTFEKSYIFYLSNPRKFEKMYRKVQSKLSEMEQEFSGRKNEMLEFEVEN
jgi:type II secretory pathway predicted ATPase ExeA